MVTVVKRHSEAADGVADLLFAVDDAVRGGGGCVEVVGLAVVVAVLGVAGGGVSGGVGVFGGGGGVVGCVCGVAGTSILFVFDSKASTSAYTCWFVGGVRGL